MTVDFKRVYDAFQTLNKMVGRTPDKDRDEYIQRSILGGQLYDLYQKWLTTEEGQKFVREYGTTHA